MLPEPGTPDLTLAVQVLFATPTEHGVVLDCTVAEDVTINDSTHIASGSPFSLLIDHDGGDGLDDGGAAGHAALALLERWCSDGVVVEATSSANSRCLVLHHDRDRLVLEVA
jgi:CxxC motif-containing protein (DUF1111 family)